MQHRPEILALQPNICILRSRAGIVINRRVLVAVLFCLTIVIERADSRSLSELLSKLELEDKSPSGSYNVASSNNDDDPDTAVVKHGDELQTLFRQASKRSQNQHVHVGLQGRQLTAAETKILE